MKVSNVLAVGEIARSGWVITKRQGKTGRRSRCRMEEAKSRSATHETEATRATIKAIAMLVVRIFRGRGANG